jgi:hypothetical protein
VEALLSTTAHYWSYIHIRQLCTRRPLAMDDEIALHNIPQQWRGGYWGEAG